MEGHGSDCVGPPRSGGKVRLSRHGVHYFDRDSGLNVLLDEVSVPEDRWSSAPRYVSMALTNACALQCPYCYAPKQPAALDESDVIRWAEELDSSGCLGLGFGGGEPTSYRGFADLCASVTERTGMAVTFTTHGHTMSPGLAARLTGVVNFVRVSVDGFGDTYEQLRGRPFDDVKRALELVATVAPFGINCVVNSHTIGQLDALAQLAASSGAMELLLLPQRPARGSRGMAPSTTDALVRWIRSGGHPVRIALSRTGLEALVPTADPFPDQDSLDAHAHVDASGMLRSDAFSDMGVPLSESFLEALGQLRTVA